MKIWNTNDSSSINKKQHYVAQGNKTIIPEMCCGSVWAIESFHHYTILCA